MVRVTGGSHSGGHTGKGSTERKEMCQCLCIVVVVVVGGQGGSSRWLEVVVVVGGFRVVAVLQVKVVLTLGPVLAGGNPPSPSPTGDPSLVAPPRYC